MSKKFGPFIRLWFALTNLFYVLHNISLVTGADPKTYDLIITTVTVGISKHLEILREEDTVCE